jgi:dTDP-glucose pyrophosphorylase/predicted transcriptional regulator
MSTKEHSANFVISTEATISEAISCLDAAGIGALAVCSSEGKLYGILTDGDLRRAMLNAKGLDSPCRAIVTRNPIVASATTSRLQALYLMNQHDIDHLPIVDAHGLLQDFLLRRDLATEDEIEENSVALLETVTLLPTASIAEAIAQIDKAGTGALVLCTPDRKLCGLLTDGDIRRAVLRHVPMDSLCEAIASRKPLTGNPSTSAADALSLMNEHDINHLPVVDANGCVTRLLVRKDLAGNGSTGLSAVIMAGGYGTRLLPLTERMPKPMLPVGDKPLLELTIQQLRRSGIRDIILTTHYLPESIVQYFGDGSAFGVRLNYLKEDYPLGTAGGLKLMRRTNNPLLVINGDIVTGLPFREMLNFHRKYHALLTVGVRKYDVQVPFGVVECDDVKITHIREKPSLNFFINAGVYLLEPSAFDFIPGEGRFDMTDLIQEILNAGKPVVSFPIMEYWLDVGQHEDYKKAQDDVLKGRI